MNVVDVLLDLSRVLGIENIKEKDICLVCYERPSDFCHRRLVADWLIENGFKCEGWTGHKIEDFGDECKPLLRQQ